MMHLAHHDQSSVVIWHVFSADFVNAESCIFGWHLIVAEAKRWSVRGPCGELGSISVILATPQCMQLVGLCHALAIAWNTSGSQLFLLGTMTFVADCVGETSSDFGCHLSARIIAASQSCHDASCLVDLVLRDNNDVCAEAVRFALYLMASESTSLARSALVFTEHARLGLDLAMQQAQTCGLFFVVLHECMPKYDKQYTWSWKRCACSHSIVESHWSNQQDFKLEVWG